MDESLIQGTQAWKEMRKSKIGASDAPVIMGNSPWKTPYQLWQQKLGQCGDDYVNSAMLRGQELESHARELLEKALDRVFYPKVCQDPAYEWRIASLDGITSDEKVICEIKCPGIKDHTIACQYSVPEKYMPQLQHIMAVTGHEKIIYASYYEPTRDFIYFDVLRDDTYIELLTHKELEFWSRVQSKQLDPNWRDVKRLDMIGNHTFDTMMRLYFDAKQESINAIEKAEQYKQEILNYCRYEEAKSALFELQKLERKGSIDYIKAFKENNIKIDFEVYRKPSSEYYTLKIIAD